MKSPLERAARALCELAGNPPGASMDGNPLWQDYLPEVRAVLAAMREPSEVMVEAARNAKFPVYRDGKDHSTIPRWRVMIDAALEEG